MKTERSPHEDIVLDCNPGMQRKPLHDEGTTELPGCEFKATLTRPIGNSNSEKVEEGYLEQMVFLLIWKEMEKEMLDEKLGPIRQFERQLDSFARSFDGAFKY